MLYLTMDAHDVERLAALAVKSLRRLGIPATPASYTVFFAHHATRFPELSAEIAALLADPSSATRERLAQVFERFFGPDRLLASLEETIADIARPVDALDQILAGSAHHNTAFTSIGHDLMTISAEVPLSAKERLDRIIAELQDLALEVGLFRDSIGKQISQSKRFLARARRQFENEHKAARTDPLTRIANRRHLEEVMAASRSGVLVMADIDHFKQFNDRHGHKAGDLVLMAFARILRQVAGEKATAARFGGEEFVLFLPDGDRDEALRMAEQARAMLDHMANITTRTGATLSKVTASFGVAAWHAGEPMDKLFERADEALYRAKKQGRNRTMVDRREG